MNNTKIKAVMDEVATEAAERDELIQCIAAVSYTHLDVYKRQRHSSAQKEKYHKAFLYLCFERNELPSLTDCYAP